jgi:hypothetical protein
MRFLDGPAVADVVGAPVLGRGGIVACVAPDIPGEYAGTAPAGPSPIQVAPDIEGCPAAGAPGYVPPGGVPGGGGVHPPLGFGDPGGVH